MSRIPHREVLRRYRRVVSVLRYLVATRQFSYVDRLAAAMSVDEVRAVVIEALRTVKSALDSAVTVISDTGSYTCCDIRTEEVPIYAGGVAVKVKVKKSSRPDIVGKEVVCYQCPELPSEGEVARLLDDVSEDIEVARSISAYALSLPTESRG
ncbi:MAG TPA: hypothetical protein ENF75_04055 [Acidilobales archaeon]|nr:hypothetical protein [Acidilobales archaeon]